MSENCRLIISDWDDVWTRRSTEAYNHCYLGAVHEAGAEMSEEDILNRVASKWGSTHTDILAEVVRDDPELLDEAIALFERMYLEEDSFVERIEGVPEAPATLEALVGKYAVALVTASHPEVLKEKVMPKLGISPDLFAMIITAYDLPDGKSKPHSYPAELIMDRLGVGRDETVVVGDDKADVKMGQNAGIEVVVTLGGRLTRQEAEDLGVGSDNIIDDVTHLPQILELNDSN